MEKPLMKNWVAPDGTEYEVCDPVARLAMGVAEVTEDGSLVINVPEGTAIKTGTQICYRDPSVIENAFAEIASNYVTINEKQYLFVTADNRNIDVRELHEKNDTIIIRIDEEIGDPLFAQVIAVVPKEQDTVEVTAESIEAALGYTPANKAVLYDGEQKLSEEQKEQARDNIGAMSAEADNYNVKLTETATYKVEENVLTDGIATLGSGWSGNMTDGFTHAKNNTEPLVFAVNAKNGESYIFEAEYSGSNLASERMITLTLGNSFATDPYNGGSQIQWGLTCVDGGSFSIIPSNVCDVTMTNLKLRKISENGMEEVTLTMKNVGEGDLSKHISGFYNIHLGPTALGKSVNCTRSIAIGFASLRDLITGGRNIGLGTFALAAMETGENNISIGADSSFYVKQAKDCIAIGKATLSYGKYLEGNVAIGASALYGEGNKKNTESAYNVGIGKQAGYYCTGKSNTYIGYNAGYKHTGNTSVFIGSSAGRDMTSGYNNVFIGSNANCTNAAASRVIAIGAGATATKSNQAVLGGDEITETLLKGNLVVRGTDGVYRQIVFNADNTCSWSEVAA